MSNYLFSNFISDVLYFELCFIDRKRQENVSNYIDSYNVGGMEMPPHESDIKPLVSDLFRILLER